MQYKNYTLFIKNGNFDESRLTSFLKTDYIKQGFLSTHRFKFTVYNFLNDDCICSRYALMHIKSVLSRFAKSDIDFVLIPKESSNKYSFIFNRVLYTYSKDKIWDSIPATPSVAIVNNSGKLIYYGPYSSDYYCGTGKDNYIDKIIDNMSQNILLPIINLSDFGCFCPNG
ncbi:MAG: DUF6436 domain-containing protein [Spirochaetia bacterium]|nr:DUF6436 domain-containing protein [Spirochaetia bacterium]